MAIAIDNPPEELVQAQAEGRVIPFVGAGLSTGLGLPSWSALLEAIAAKIPDLPAFDEIRQACGDDPLKIAEYLFIAGGNEIGPLRQKISDLISRPDLDPSVSHPHVELVNLFASRIYTTNYDDLIERTFAALGIKYQLIANARHISRVQGDRPQIVKFHGDLQWENSLVFTESSYFERLQFESPIDIKLRSDLLGNSVLFLGYGFSDTNVRVMWHRLMSMMKGVDPAERPQSFIVRMRRDRVREQLDEAVGIRTVVLTDALDSDLSRRLGLFLALLAERGGAGREQRRFLSTGVLETLHASLANGGRGDTAERQALDRLSSGRMPIGIKDRVEALIDDSKSYDSPFAGEVLTLLSALYALEFGDPGDGSPATGEDDG
ncbi:MAG: SIR2 family protein [Jatrophihabitantaceae bacterium]